MAQEASQAVTELSIEEVRALRELVRNYKRERKLVCQFLEKLTAELERAAMMSEVQVSWASETVGDIARFMELLMKGDT